MYDVIIIGAGIIGASVARNLAKYNTRVLVLEKDNDVCEETSMANSAIIHSGYDPKPGTLKAILNVKGNAMFDKLCEDLDVEFKRIGSITVAKEDQVAQLKELELRAKENKVPVRIIEKEELHKMEPNLSDDIVSGLLAPTCGIINPFELCVGLIENAMDNGVELKLNSKVTKISKTNNIFEVFVGNIKYECKNVINCAGVFSDEIAHMIGNNDIDIQSFKGEYYVLDHFKGEFVNHTLFPLPTLKGKGILVSPTTHGNYIIGPNSNLTDDEDKSITSEGLDEISSGGKTIIKNIPFDQVIRTFAGLRAKDVSGDFVIKEDANVEHFYHCAGIQSPGIASSPAIAEYIIDILLKKNHYELRKDFNPVRRPLVKLSRLSDEERNDLIKKNPAFGHIVCRCEKVSEGEIIDVIHRNCGATTIKGVKKRIRPGFGKCQGGFCEPLVLKILARELNKDPLEIKYASLESDILIMKSKEAK